MFVGLVSDVEKKDAHKEAALWALGRALREKGVFPVILREPVYSGNVSEFLAGQMAVLAHEREILRRYGIFDQISGFAGVEDAACRAFEDSVWAGGKKVPVYDKAFFLLPQLRYHGISQKPETEENYLFVDVSGMTPKIACAIQKLAKRKGISHVIMVRYTGADERMLTEEAALSLIGTVLVEDTKGYIGALWMCSGVVTDRYAGVSLALIHETPFLAVETAAREESSFKSEESSHLREGGQIRTLLEFFSLTGHIYKPGEEVGDCFEIQDKDSLHKGLRLLRDREGGRVAEELLFEDANMLVKCPVKIPLSQCSACGACEAGCPENAIRMEADEYGFLHPVVDESLCTDCGNCSEVCIKRGQRQLVQFSDDSYPRFYLAQAKEQSGAAYSGIFGQLVRYLVKERDAVVFGGILNEELKPVVTYTQDVDMAERFAEKRYLINDTRQAFRKVKEFLDADRFVLYTGSAC
ncbi:MAG: 4Fe-4S dicluster domain-containing protein, partial [Lachnospiraceae bacterium]|nr:4Fe-4S dicluster domain-containing protein [Lachnospiraceae bacterium]